jgi:hypothetical protein
LIVKEQDVIEEIREHTEWCAPIVVVPKGNDKVRICVDLTKVNEAVRRKRIMLPTVHHTIAQMVGAKIFSKMDVNSGFYQICLDEESRKLCTFITSFGRFCYKRMLFGLKSGRTQIYWCSMSDG